MKKLQLFKRLVLLAIACFFAANAFAAPAKLPACGADPSLTSVSGLSSGAFMAVQLQVAYSASIVGAGIVAGGPYYCAADNVAYTKICMGQLPFLPPNPFLMANAAVGFSGLGQIDPLANLATRRVYLFSGTNDTVVRQPAVDAAEGFFRLVGVKTGNLQYVNNIPAGHAFITPRYGNDCDANAAPYISHCTVRGKEYDQAGALLRQIYGKLSSRVDRPTGRLMSFDQRPFAEVGSGLADSGYLYVPRSCGTNDSRCRVHVALHGCKQAKEFEGETFSTQAGYNNWADSNNIIVLYPQIQSSKPLNPYGCWDWWGYTGVNYALKSGVQMKAIKAMVDRLTQRR